MNIDDEEDFPLADHPGPGGPKAGDPDMNRARDLQHLDVQRGKQPTPLEQRPRPAEVASDRKDTGAMFAVPADAPIMIAWNAFKQSEGYANSKHWAAQPEHLEGSLWSMFMAGWIARDSQPKE